MVTFNLENKITWEELSPSLQELFKTLQSQASKNREDIIINKNNISTLTTNVNNITNTINNEIKPAVETITGENGLQKAIKKGLCGQVIKINKDLSGVIADDDFRIVHFVDNAKDLKKEQSRSTIDIKEVFDTWTRFAHYDQHAVASRLDHSDKPSLTTGQNLPIYSGQYNWEFDPATKSISQTKDGPVIAGFISPTDYYTNYLLRVKANCGWDDDNIMLICGYMKDSSGVEHTLMIVRGAGTTGSTPAYPNNFNESYADTFFWWGLIYDMGNPTQHVIINYNDKVGIQGTQDNNACACYMTLIRQDHTIIGKTSDFDPNGRDLGDREDLTFTWTYPSTKPSDMTQAEYDNIGVMLNQTNRVGFGVRSGQPTFSIDKQQEVFEDNDIYDLSTDTVWTYDSVSGTWTKKGKVSEDIPNRTFLYNPDTKKFYFYHYWGKYTNIDIGTSTTVPSLMPDDRKYGRGLLSGMVNRLDKENDTTYWEDYFFIVRAVSGSGSGTTSQLDYEKSLGIDLEEVFKKWQRVSSRGGLSTQDLADDAGDRNAYGYIDKYSTIYNKNNNDVATAFISNSIYSTNFTITIKITRDATIYSAAGITPDDDDDALWFVAGWMVDSDGMYHDISVVRIGGADEQWGNNQFFICYDALHRVNFFTGDSPSPIVLASISVPKRHWSDGECYLKVIKTEGKLECWTSDISTSVTAVDPNYHITYTTPTSIPSGLSQSDFNNIVTMMTGNSKIGFGNCSNAGAFMVTEQEYLFKDEIFDLDNDVVWKYINGVWVKSGKISEVIPPRSLLYNQRLKTLYWYQGPGNWVNIDLGGNGS